MRVKFVKKYTLTVLYFFLCFLKVKELDILISNYLDDKSEYKKSNLIINSKGRASLLSQRLFAISLNYATVDKKTNSVISVVPIKELNEILGRKSKSLYSSTMLATIKDSEGKRNSLVDWRIVRTDEKTKKFTVINVIQTATYDNGVLQIKYNSDLTDQLIDLKANYTILSLKDTAKLKTAYSFRLYEMAKSQLDYLRAVNKSEGVVEWKVHLVELQYRLGILSPEDIPLFSDEFEKNNPNYDLILDFLKEKNKIKYSRFTVFRSKVLEKAISEINLYTPIQVRYDVIRRGVGARVREIIFYIDDKHEMVEDPEDDGNEIDDVNSAAVEEISKCLSQEKLSLFEVNIIAEAADYDAERVRKAYDVALAQDEISNFVGFMLSAIKDNYEPPKKRRKKRETFIDSNGKEMMMGVDGFAERVYDYGELERKLRKN